MFEAFAASVTYFNGLTNATESVLFESATFFVSSNIETGDVEDLDYDYESDTQDELPTFVIVSGVVKADSERINTEGVPEEATGATVTISWTDDVTFNTVDFVTTTDASGVYNVQVPLNEISNSRVNITFEEFTTAVDYNDGFRNVTGFNATFDNASFPNQNISLGTELVRNYSYDSDFKDALPTFGLIAGTIEARVNEVTGDVNPVVGLQIRVEWDDSDGITQAIFLTTNSTGEYTTEVPLAEADDFVVRVPEFVVDPYVDNDGSANGRETSATYGETTQSVFNVTAGQERDNTDFSLFFPASVD
ncbi:MAG: hypothetical protein AAF616_04945 [Bacteroidota bacterium]